MQRSAGAGKTRIVSEAEEDDEEEITAARAAQAAEFEGAAGFLLQPGPSSQIRIRFGPVWKYSQRGKAGGEGIDVNAENVEGAVRSQEESMAEWN